MAKKTIGGVRGVLGTLITESESGPPQPERIRPAATPSAKTLPRKPETQPRVKARTGRPLGRKDGEGTSREKVTVWVDSTIIAEYRDWSWDERCHLGELMERALASYLKRRRPRE
ncbi:MAG: hypothetical protein AB7I30_05600 [Isosphaeraceae bacterium]